VRQTQGRLQGISQDLVIDRGCQISQEELALVRRAAVAAAFSAAASAAAAAVLRKGLAEHVAAGGVEPRRRGHAKVGARGEALVAAAAVAAPSATAELLEEALVLIVRLLAAIVPASASLHPRHVAGVLRLDAGLDGGGKPERVPAGAAA